MRSATLTLTLLDDVVLSRRNATTGEHESLDFIPGSALLGVAAARLYAKLNPADAWTVFHDARVRYGDALPLAAASTLSWPVPLSWHENKADPDGAAVEGGCWHSARVFNLAADQAELRRNVVDRFQPRGLREGHVTGCGWALKSVKRRRMMTAIAIDGRAATGQLFGYEGLAAGQRFRSELRFDATVPDALVQQVLDAFRQGSVRIGRSRATHYGRAALDVDGPADAQLTAPRGVDRLLHLLLLSDACLRDSHGQATLRPDGSLLGLPGAALVDERSFLRSRRYSPWNAHRAMPETERQVLVAGSVLTLQRAGGFTESELTALVWRGIGCSRAAGLGAVALQPALLEGLHPQPLPRAKDAGLGSSQDSRAEAAGAVVPPKSALIQALVARALRSAHAPQADQWVEQQLAGLRRRWTTIRSYHGWPAQQAHGPGASQWGMVADAASKAAKCSELRDRLFGPADAAANARRNVQDGLVRSDDDDWDGPQQRAPAQGDNAQSSLRDWLMQALDAAAAAFPADDAAALDALQRLMHATRRQSLWASEAALRPTREKA